jgi:large subunit ribosomal protein L29
MNLYAQYEEMNEGRLVEELHLLKRAAMNLRFQRATGQLEKPSLIRRTRRDIARIQTALRAKRPDKAVVTIERKSRLKPAYAYEDPPIRGQRSRNHSGTDSTTPPLAKTAPERTSPQEGTSLTEASDVGSMILEPTHRRLLGEILDMAHEERRDSSLSLLASEEINLTDALVNKVTSAKHPPALIDTDVNAARHAIKKILPLLTNGSMTHASRAARVLVWLAWFEPKLGEERTSAAAKRLTKLLERYPVPCFIDIGVNLDNGRQSGRFVVTATDTIELGKGAGSVQVQPQKGSVVEVYVKDAEQKTPRRALRIPLDETGDVQEQVPFQQKGEKRPSVLTVYYNGKQLAERAAFAR